MNFDTDQDPRISLPEKRIRIHIKMKRIREAGLKQIRIRNTAFQYMYLYISHIGQITQTINNGRYI